MVLVDRWQLCTRTAGRRMTSIGTLISFTLVCAAVLVVRRTMPDVPRSFKTPLVPLIPILGILYLPLHDVVPFLPIHGYAWCCGCSSVWDIYVGYGMKHSKLEHGATPPRAGDLNMIGLILAVLCVIPDCGTNRLWDGEKAKCC